MPRFLDTITGEFVWKDNVEDVVYAILSHTWRPEGEQSYADVLKLQAEVDAERKLWHSPTPPSATTLGTPLSHAALSDTADAALPGPTLLSHPRLSAKIKSICKAAGYRLVWNDACCIDKSSSAELSLVNPRCLAGVVSIAGWQGDLL